jgi:probable rRNA maturation factor
MNGGEEDRLQQLALDMLVFLEREQGVVNVHLVDDETMRELNARFRGKDATTTVLSFESPVGFPEVPLEKKVLGEIFLSPTCIADREEPIEFFLIHGVLHLIGFSHEEKSDRIEMERIEDKVLLWLKNR